jgi:hypothetical protein
MAIREIALSPIVTSAASEYDGQSKQIGGIK